MTYIPLSIGITLLLIIFVANDASWENFSATFPKLSESTVGPYFIIISSIVLTLAIRKTFASLSTEKKAKLSFAGLQIASIVSLLSAFIYSFSLINLLISLKYFLLLQVLIYSIFYGGARFIGDVKRLDKSSTSRRAEEMQTYFDLKKLVFELKQRSISETVACHIDALLFEIKDKDRIDNSELVHSATALFKLLQEEQKYFMESKRLEALIKLMGKK